MLGKDHDAYERLRRLSGTTGRVLEGLLAACVRPGGGPGRPCAYPLQVQVLVFGSNEDSTCRTGR